jgi:uncharacterized protein YoaH (UPF0181 family)
MITAEDLHNMGQFLLPTDQITNCLYSDNLSLSCLALLPAMPELNLALENAGNAFNYAFTWFNAARANRKAVPTILENLDDVANNMANPLTDKLSLSNIRDITKNQITNGGTNAALDNANQLIDDLMSQGMSEAEAITKVGTALTPEYAITAEQQLTLTSIADKAKNADQLVMCPYTWCRHNATLSDAIAKSRGLDPSRATMTLNGGGGHQFTAVTNPAGGQTFIDVTNNLTFNSVDEMTSVWESVGKFVNTLELTRGTVGTNGLTNWQVINLIGN